MLRDLGLDKAAELRQAKHKAELWGKELETMLFHAQKEAEDLRKDQNFEREQFETDLANAKKVSVELERRRDRLELRRLDEVDSLVLDALSEPYNSSMIFSTSVASA